MFLCRVCLQSAKLKQAAVPSQFPWTSILSPASVARASWIQRRSTNYPDVSSDFKIGAIEAEVTCQDEDNELTTAVVEMNMENSTECVYVDIGVQIDIDDC